MNKKGKEKNFNEIFRLGDSKVGKTSCPKSNWQVILESILFPTIGVDYKTKKVMIEPDVQWNVKLWDTAGQERLQSLSKNLLKKADGALLLYDITDKKTLNNIEKWVDRIKNNSSDTI